MKNDFNLICHNMLKHVKYTIFHENFTFLEDYTYINTKFSTIKKLIVPPKKAHFHPFILTNNPKKNKHFVHKTNTSLSKSK